MKLHVAAVHASGVVAPASAAAVYEHPAVPVHDPGSPAVNEHVTAVHASSSVPAVPASSAVYEQPAVVVQEAASPAVKRFLEYLSEKGSD